MKNIYLSISDQLQTQSDLVLATVTRTVGSAPQKSGASAIFGKNGLIAGTIGGGIVEGKVQKIALEAMISKKSGHYQFNLGKGNSDSEDAICGGQINILVESGLSNHIKTFEKIKRSLSERIPGVLITVVTRYSEISVLINRYWMTESEKPFLPSQVIEKIEPAAISLLSKGRPSGLSELELVTEDEEPSSQCFLEAVFPPSRLVIAGAGHIGKVLSNLGSLLGFEITVIDDRREFANPERLTDADHIIVKDIGEAMQELEKNSDTYVVIVTRGHNDDAAALKPCIGSDLAYLGMIGSRNKIATMRKAFIDNGWADDSQWDEIYAPVGLDILSQTVEEIAVSIAAQLVLVRNSGQKSIRLQRKLTRQADINLK